MDSEQTRIEEDLRGVVLGDVLCDDASRALYATDGSLFEVWPLAVVRPRSVDDVSATVAWAAERGVAVHARGAGSGVCGAALGGGVVLDLARFMRRIVAFDAEAGRVRVQAGVVGSQLTRHLARSGRLFGPDPANLAVTTVGGMIGRNASGSRLSRHGSIRNWIASAQVVLGDGSVVELAPAPPPDPRAAPGSGISSRETAAEARPAALAGAIAAILRTDRGLVARSQPPARRSHGGYGLHDLEPVEGGPIDLPRVLCGAEGTLGIVTEATLRCEPAAGTTAVGLLFFDSLERAAEVAVKLAPLKPSAGDLFDRRHLVLARSAQAAFDVLIPPVAEAGLLVEFAAAERRECQARLDDALAMARRSRRGCIDFRRAEDEHDAAFFWELSRTAVSILSGVRAVVRPVSFLEDVVVPPPAVPEFLRRLEEVLRREQATAMVFGHALHGQMHVRPYVDPRDPATRGRLESLAEAVYAEAAACGGSIGGELGLGLSRVAAFGRLFPELVQTFARVKEAFDPAGVLAPGRVIDSGAAAAAEFRGPLARTGTAADASPEASTPGGAALPILNWSAGQLAAEVDACSGCGGCRTGGRGLERMCPRFRETTAEEASPRAKANLVAALLSGHLDPQAVRGEMLQAVAETCFNCHQCRAECAAAIDIPALVLEIKAAQVAVNSLPLRRRLLSRIDGLSAWAGALAPLANWALANPQARWILEKTLGIARGRKLPPVTGNRFLRWAARRGLTRPSRRSGPRVLYFLDTYARRHDPLLGQAFVGLLERHGIGVLVDPRQVAAGMPLVSEGDVDAARRLARTNVRVLAEAVRLGYRIVCTEPAAATCIRHDYPLLVEDDELPQIAAATCDATTYLWELHREGRLRLDFRPVPAQVLYHAPCHARSGPLPTPGEHLLRLIPGLAVRSADAGCSGMAGTFGLAREHYRTSLRIGLGVMTAMRGPVTAGATECSACRIQMEQGTTKPAIHPVKLLAMASGLLPGAAPAGLDDALTASSGRLVTT